MKRILLAAAIVAVSFNSMASEQKGSKIREASRCVQMDASWDNATTLDAALDMVSSDESNGCISPVQAADRRVSLAKKFMPADFDLHTLLEYRLLLETQLSKGSISPEEYRYKAAAAMNRHMADAIAKESAAQNSRAADERRRQEALSAVAGQQEAANNAARAGAVAGALQGIGNAFRSYPAAPASARSNCLSHVQGGTLVTSCY